MKRRIVCFFLALTVFVSAVPTLGTAAKAENEGTAVNGAGDLSDATNETSGTGVLPEDYTMVDYIESHGTEYIDTGVVPTAKMRAEVTYQLTDTAFIYADSTKQGLGVFGAYTTGNSSAKNDRFQIVSTTNEANITYGIGEGSATAANDTEPHLAVLDAKNKTCTLDGTAITGTKAFTNDGFTASTKSILIFGVNGAVIYTSKCKMYAVKIYEDNMLTHDYVPCQENGSYVYGFYDLLTNQFLENASGKGRADIRRASARRCFRQPPGRCYAECVSGL